MKKLISAAIAVLLLAGCADGEKPAETTAAETTAVSTTAEKITMTAETTTTVTTTTVTTTTAEQTEDTVITKELASPPPMSDECRELYGAFLTDILINDEYVLGRVGFDLYDMDSDGTPELFLSRYPAHGCGVEIYTVSGGELKMLGGESEMLGAYGVAQVCGEHLMSAYTGGGGSIESYYVKNGDTLEQLAALENNYFPPEEYFINGEEVTKEEYESEQLKYAADWEDVGRRYYLFPNTVKAVFGYNAVPPMSDECRAAYKALLSGVRFVVQEEDGSQTAMTRFDLYDLDSDGTPELFFSHGDLNPDTVTICTFSGGAAVDLTEKLGERMGSHGYVTAVGGFIENSYGYLSFGSYDFYALENGSLVEAAHLGYAPSGEPYVDENNDGIAYNMNGEQLSKDDFWETLYTYEKASESVTLGRTYPADDETLERFFG